jgi:hypothetical protein
MGAGDLVADPIALRESFCKRRKQWRDADALPFMIWIGAA